MKQTFSLKTEILSGVSVFIALIYVLILNANLLQYFGISFNFAFFATLFSVAFATLLGSFISDKPFVLAPYLGESAFAVFVLNQNKGLCFEQVLFCAFIAALILVIFSINDLRFNLINSIPDNLKTGLTVAIGGFLMLVAVKETGVVDFFNNNLVFHFASFKTPRFFIFALCFSLIVILKKFNFKANIIFAVLLSSCLSFFLIEGNFVFEKDFCVFNEAKEVFQKFGCFFYSGNFDKNTIVSIFSLFILLFFDTNSILLALKKVFKLESKKVLKKVYLSDSLAAALSPFFSCISSGIYPESLLFKQTGAKTKIASIVVAVLFFLSIFLLPFIKCLPYFVISSVLFYIGFCLVSDCINFDFSKKSSLFASVLMIILMIKTLNLSVSIAGAFVAYFVFKILFSKTKRFDKICMRN